MGIVLARLDQRLVHGIVVTQWASTTNAERIMVINDLLAVDENRKTTMRLSKPAGTGMSLIDYKTAVANFKLGKYDNHRVLLVVDSPTILIKLAEDGIAFDEVDVGIVFDASYRTKYTTHVSLSTQELSELKTLQNYGKSVYLQFSPQDKKIDVSDL